MNNFWPLKFWVAAILLSVSLSLSAVLAAEAGNQLVGPAKDRAYLIHAIEVEKPSFEVPAGVTGITVPHHLLAVDLIARGFWAASGKQYKRIVVISPDHFRLVKGRFATSEDSFSTPFGLVPVDRKAVDSLRAASGLFEIDKFDNEHGLQSEMPFIKYFFPDAKVVPVLASISTTPEDWREVVNLLKELVDDETLVVQSTDYSHYLPLEQAIRRDQESISVISGIQPSAVGGLIQPDHMDSKAAEYIQMSLQKEVFGAKPTIIANRNSVEYGGRDRKTTSYIVTVFHRDPDAFSGARYQDQTVIYFGGDTLLGRYFLPALMNRAQVSYMVKQVKEKTSGGPIIVNLEGILTSQPVTNAPTTSHLMNVSLAGPILKQLNVVAAGMANNHIDDFGEIGIGETARSVRSLQIRPLLGGEVADFGSFRIIAMLMPTAVQGARAVVDAAVKHVCEARAQPPYILMVHWGEEYTSQSSDEERRVAQEVSSCGVAAIIGAHSHKASSSIEAINGRTQMVFSLGNFLFDQDSNRSSSALLEMRTFKQGTVALRLLPMKNLFEIAAEDSK